MVYKIVWTAKALESYVSNMQYLAQAWTEKEVKRFAALVEKRIKRLSQQPETGTPRNKKQLNIRHTVLHKRVSLIYRVKPQKKELELLLFSEHLSKPLKIISQITCCHECSYL